MAFPAGMILCTCSVGASLMAVGGAPVGLDVTVTPVLSGTVRLTWAPTGAGLSLASQRYHGEPGEMVTFQVPAVDQAGFIDGGANAFTMWSYRVQWRESGAQPWNTVVFQPLASQSVGAIDVDLLPDGTVGVPGSAPVPAVTSVNGFTGNVTIAASSGVTMVDNGDGTITITTGA